jgi:tripartite-type tricarboxylate transporter receptor subunit TctC
MLFTTTISAAPHIKTGKVKGLALTSAKRLDSMPGVPTIGETLKGYEAEAFQGMIAPAGVPRAIIEKLGREVAAIVKSPEISKTFEASGAVAVGSTPAEFSAFIKTETAKWGKVIKDAGIKLEQ